MSTESTTLVHTIENKIKEIKVLEQAMLRDESVLEQLDTIDLDVENLTKYQSDFIPYSDVNNIDKPNNLDKLAEQTKPKKKDRNCCSIL